MVAFQPWTTISWLTTCIQYDRRSDTGCRIACKVQHVVRGAANHQSIAPFLPRYHVNPSMKTISADQYPRRVSSRAVLWVKESSFPQIERQVQCRNFACVINRFNKTRSEDSLHNIALCNANHRCWRGLPSTRRVPLPPLAVHRLS